MKAAFVLALSLAFSGCLCDDPSTPECRQKRAEEVAQATGQAMMIVDQDGIKVFKVWRDGIWVYYSVDAKRVHWEERYQCGTYPQVIGKTVIIQPLYCSRERESIGEIQ